jgi:cell division protein FtsI (penicillin-binding protein 3)
VFKEVAQQVLEYLGVPHDTPLEPEKELEQAQQVPEEAPAEHTGDLQALFAEVNDLPADDPLRNPEPKQQPLARDGGGQGVAAQVSAGQGGSGQGGSGQGGSGQGTAAGPPANAGPEMEQGEAAANSKLAQLQKDKVHGDYTASATLAPATPAVAVSGRAPDERKPDERKPDERQPLVTDGKHRVAVPSFAGESVRRVVENAGTAGLAVQLLGTGIAREQAPPAGTMVPMGTEIVVRFAR